jgi:hypothetical protein
MQLQPKIQIQTIKKSGAKQFDTTFLINIRAKKRGAKIAPT